MDLCTNNHRFCLMSCRISACCDFLYRFLYVLVVNECIFLTIFIFSGSITEINISYSQHLICLSGSFPPNTDSETSFPTVRHTFACLMNESQLVLIHDWWSTTFIHERRNLEMGNGSSGVRNMIINVRLSLLRWHCDRLIWCTPFCRLFPCTAVPPWFH